MGGGCAQREEGGEMERKGGGVAGEECDGEDVQVRVKRELT